MAIKKKGLVDYFLQKIENGAEKEVKEIIENLDEPQDFLIILTILSNGEDKNFLLKINCYELLFERFLLISDLFNPDLLKKIDWHKWTVFISEISNILWKSRNNFKPSIWIKMIKRIHEISFTTMGKVESNIKQLECKNCSKLFSNLFSNLAEYASVDDIKLLELPPLEKIIDIYEKQVRVDWANCHYRSVIESKFFPLENTM